MNKKRNPQDSTLRNVRAANKKLDLIIRLLRQLKKRK